MLSNVHESLSELAGTVEKIVVRGDYQYWHYLCDGTDDRL